MGSNISAARAITGVTFQRVFRPAVLFVGTFLAILYILITIAAVKISMWWLIFLIVLVPATLVIAAIAWLLWKISESVAPRKITKNEKKDINEFIDSLLGIWEVKSTPMPLVAFLIGKDLIRRRKSTYIEEIVNNSRSLKTDFAQIAKMFE